MFNFIREYKLKKAFSSYVYKLGPSLKKRYGTQKQYTVCQIKRTANDLHLNAKHLPYAIALYRYEASKNTVNLYRIDQHFLNLLRQDVADSIFCGNTMYTVKDVFALSMKFSNHFVREDFNKAGSGL